MWKKNNSFLAYIEEPQVEPRNIFVFDLYGVLVASKVGKEKTRVDNENDFIFFPGIIDKLSNLSSFELVAYSSFAKYSQVIVDLFKNISSQFKEKQIKVSLIAGIKHTIEDGLNEYLKLTNSSDVDSVSYVSHTAINGLNPDTFFEEELDLVLPEKTVAIVVGNPKSGKTRLCKILSEENEVALINLNSCAYSSHSSLLSSQFSTNQSFVVDGHFVTSSDRSLVKKLANEYGYHLVVYWILRDGRFFNSKLPAREQTSSSSYNNYSSKFSIPLESVKYVR